MEIERKKPKKRRHRGYESEEISYTRGRCGAGLLLKALRMTVVFDERLPEGMAHT